MGRPVASEYNKQLGVAFAKAVGIEQERRERRKQEWILNNRNSANPGTTTTNYQRYGPGAGR